MKKYLYHGFFNPDGNKRNMRAFDSVTLNGDESKMIKIKTFLHNMSNVEENVNEWLEENAEKEIIDIQTHGDFNDFIAVIIYEVNP